MSEPHTRLTRISTESPTHRATQHPRLSAQHTKSHLASHVSTHTTQSITYPVHKPSTMSTPSSTGFAYPTPTNVPKANATIISLSITVSFLVILLGAAIAVIVVKVRNARRNEERYSFESRVEIAVGGPSNFRTWMGKKIEARVPMNGYA